MVIVWTVRGKIIRSVLCSIVCNDWTQWTAHTRTEPTVLWIGVCLTGPISLCLDSFCVCIIFVSDCILYAYVVLRHGEVDLAGLKPDP